MYRFSQEALKKKNDEADNLEELFRERVSRFQKDERLREQAKLVRCDTESAGCSGKTFLHISS